MLWKSVNAETADLLQRVAQYESGLFEPGGPGAQPYRLVQAAGIIAAEVALLDAKDAEKRSREAKRQRWR